MSLAGVGNLVFGTVIVNVATRLLTPDEKKAATKKDIEELKSLISDRYLPVNNIDIYDFGRKPFYDVDTVNVIYLHNMY